MNEPFGHFARRAEGTPRALFFDDGQQAMAFGQAARVVRCLAHALRRAGISPGERVALDVPGRLHALLTEALFHEGAISLHRPPPGAHALRVAWLITTNAARMTDERVIVADRRFLEAAMSLGPGIEPRDLEDDAVCRIVFSSGTTGSPKAVAFTVAMIEGRCDDAERFWLHTRPFLCTLDMATVSGFQTFYSGVRSGNVYRAPGTGADNARHLTQAGIRSIKASPVQIAELIDALPVDATLDLEIIQFAGAMLPEFVARKARARTGARIVNLYGCTETGNVSIRALDSDDPHDAGYLTPGTDLQVVDAHDQPCPPGVEGLIRYRRPLQATGYVDDPEASARFFRDGWFHPGDRGALGLDGDLTLAGREGELINAGGVKVDPQRIDGAAAALPGVRDAAGFALARPDGLQDVALAVVTESGFDAEVVVRALRDALGSGCPSVVVEVERIPRNGIGKVLRAQLATECGARLAG